MHSIASAYLRPSWNTWPTSMPRAMPSVPLPSGEGSPSTTLRMSATSVGFGQVAAPVDAGEVEARLVGADDEIGHRRDAAVGDDADRLLRRRAGRGSRARCRGARRFPLRSRAGIRPGPAACASLISLTTWSPRTSASTNALPSRRRPSARPTSPCAAAGCRISAATSSQVFCVGVSTLRKRLGRGGARARRDRFGQFDVGRVVGPHRRRRSRPRPNRPARGTRARRCRRSRRCRRAPRGTSGPRRVKMRP